MLICPGCKSEYQTGIKVCPDCDKELIEIDLIDCENCGESLDSKFRYCTHCGMVLEASTSDIKDECENHPGADAIGACIICGKPVCNDCAKISGKKIFCEKDEHLKLYGDYVLVTTCATEYEAQMKKAIIEMSGITCVLFSQKDHVFFSNVGTTAIVNIMVPKEDADKAFQIIKEMNNQTGDQLTEDENE